MKFQLVTNRPGRRLLLIRWVHALFLTFIASVGVVALTLSLDLNDMVYAASALVSAVVIWSFASWHLIGQRCTGPYGLFLLSASLFNGGQAFLEVLGLTSNGPLQARFSGEITAQALYLVALGIAALHLGALLAIGPKRVAQPNPTDEARNHATRVVGWLFLVTAAFPTALVLKDLLATVSSAGYMGLYDRPSGEFLPSAVRVFAACLVPGVMFVAAGNPKRRLVLTGLWIFLLAYCGSMVFAGVRREGAPVLIAFAWLYHTRIKRLPRTALITAGIALLAIFAIVAVTRISRVSWQEAIEQARATSDAVDSPIVAAISEMGGTLSTVAHTINLVPVSRPFDYGMGYLYTLLTLMPNVGFDLHPAAAHGSYSDWLVNTVDPGTAYRGGGFGFSFIAEPFANFGWYGVVPLLAVIGFLIVRISDWATQSDDPAKYATVASLLAFLLFFPRAESATIIRSLVYHSFLPYMAVGFIAQKKLRAKSEPAVLSKLFAVKVCHPNAT